MSPSPLAPLLEAQELDLAARAASKRSEELPERAMVPELARGIERLTTSLDEARAEREALEVAEAELGKAVSTLVQELEVAEVERYSGKHKSRDDARAHDEAQQARREKQASLEEEELGLLESIETVEARIADAETEIERQRLEGRRVTEAIRKVEAEVEAELSRIATERARLLEPLPADVVATYDRVRAGKTSAGRGATALVDGSCTGCRITLPSLEKRRMLEEPPEALLQCPQCRRVLVRQ